MTNKYKDVMDIIVCIIFFITCVVSCESENGTYAVLCEEHSL